MLRKRLAQSVLYAAIAAGTSAFAASQPVISTPATPAPVVTSATTPVAQNAQVWNLKNADIRAVIQTISVLTGKNFIIDPRVHGNISLISQKPMTPDELYQIFLSMLQLLQYVAIPSGNVIKIVPAMDANSLSRDVATKNNPGTGDEVVVRVVPVNHVSATELVPVLRPLMSQSGSVSAYLPSNSLILAGTASNIKRLVQVIHQMDSADSNQISVVHLHYASAKKIVSIIHALQTGNASQGSVSNATLAADTDDNSILISANMANQLLMHNLIEELDQKSSQGEDTRVVTLNYLSAKKLAPILTKVAQGMSASDAVSGGKGAAASGSSSSDVSIQSEDSSNAIIMHAPAAMLNNLVRVIRRLDSKPQEVLVEAIIVKINENVLDKLGIIWGTANGTTGGAPADSVTKDHSFVFKINRSDIGLLPDGNLLSLLRVLKQNGSTDILSTPSVVVLDNQKAMIKNGQNVGLANRQYQGASSATTGDPTQNIVTPFNTIQRQDVALSLDVTPHISPNNMIRMELLQKDDTLAPDATAGGNNDNPTINTSQIKTSVLVKSGDILVLGGLVDNEQDKTKQKLPILGNLPLIGHLFRYDTNKMEKTDLMVFIRPIIMSKNLAKKQTTNRYEYMRQQQIDMSTEHLRKQVHMPMLPEINPNKAHLPQPLSTLQLPIPETTENTNTIGLMQ